MGKDGVSGQGLIDLGINAAKLGHSIVEGVAKPLPGIGVGVSGASLLNNLGKIQEAKDKKETIKDKDILNTISDTTGLIASAAGTAAVSGAAAAFGVALGPVAVGLGVISLATGIIALGMEDSTTISDAVSAMNKAFSELVDTLGEAYDKALENISEALDKALDKASDIFDFLESALKDFLDKVEPFLPFLNIGLYDPIALDLNNNGKIDTLSLENGVFFDHNGDEIAFKSSWISGGDGILARDINGDKEINSGAELFGNFTKLKNGELAKNGAEALKDLDDNNDG
ncbi:MAG: hypothetical protein PUB35_04625, partial [Campylobacteraceae bacterium]|nr:hypothetical protein [Campylobacteraceae bacterium]